MTKTKMDSKRERAHRILDAASSLILRWGYNKTTIDDIARQAGVAKGTIYLHWKSRQDLFIALLKRERLEHARDFSQRISSDPQGYTLAGIARHSVMALSQRPLIKALLLHDMDILGRIAPQETTSESYAERMVGFRSYLELMRHYGLVRTDLSLQKEVHIWSAVFSGFLTGSSLMPTEFALADEELADMIAETIQRTLETGQTVPIEEYEQVRHAFSEYMELGIAVLEEQFQQELMD